MILRLSQRLSGKIKVTGLGDLPLDNNPFTDWSCHVFTAGRVQYIMITNTVSLYSFVMFGRGITDDGDFVEQMLGGLRGFTTYAGHGNVYDAFIGPSIGSVKFSRPLSRTVTGSMNDLIYHARFWIEEGLVPFLVGERLNSIPKSALNFISPGEMFKALYVQQSTAVNDRDAGPAMSGREKCDLVSPSLNGNTADPTLAWKKSSRQDGKLLLSGKCFQFKITLDGIKPSIWRRIQVRDCTLDKLHEHIQSAMGWTNCHLHRFEIEGMRYGDPELLEDDFQEFKYDDSTKTMVSEVLPNDHTRFAFKYEYDFGDSWEHEILFEGIPHLDTGASPPFCLEGERACPPEDCGGVWGYGDLLEKMASPGREENASRVRLVGGNWNPEEFDAEMATKAMQKGLPNWRSMDDAF